MRPYWLQVLQRESRWGAERLSTRGINGYTVSVIRTECIGNLVSAASAGYGVDPRRAKLITGPLGGPEIATSRRAETNSRSYPWIDSLVLVLLLARARIPAYLGELSFRRDDGHRESGDATSLHVRGEREIPIAYPTETHRRPPLARSGCREALRILELVGHDVFDWLNSSCIARWH